jgi:hypothetical protein
MSKIISFSAARLMWFLCGPLTPYDRDKAHNEALHNLNYTETQLYVKSFFVLFCFFQRPTS